MRPDDASVSKAFDEAPEIIREALTDGLAIEFMAKLTTRYGIHIDTAGLVTEFIRDMLLGLVRPETFIGKLTSVGIDPTLARQMTADLNKEVFVPLRDKVRGSGERMRVQPQAPVMRVMEPEKEKSKEILPEKPVEKISEQPPYNLIGKVQVETKPAPVTAPLTAIVSKQDAPVPTMRTMQHDMELVQHGNQPTPYPAPSLPHPSQATPARMFQTASVPVTAPVAPKIPEMVHIIPDAKPQPAKEPQVSPIVPREYTSDPYREPI